MTMTATDWARLDELLAKCEENQGLGWNDAEELDILATKAEMEGRKCLIPIKFLSLKKIAVREVPADSKSCEGCIAKHVISISVVVFPLAQNREELTAKL